MSIVAHHRAGDIEDKYNMEYDVVITRVRMVLVSVPIAATYVKLDVTCDTFGWRTGMFERKLEHGIANIRPLRTARTPRITQKTHSPIYQRQRLHERQCAPSMRKVLFENLGMTLGDMMIV